ncbi:unnamed protein product (macronuclear) [Paramecium tetraurelia]|uniref:Protein kinase domain-containing protein n=1 Tax=Paramecium tetraurelia TaxID=5888 RepID=A0CEY3_PARTE|nr:uncharacterized protein GSPATT00037789001 [Paramecium tetraurelia]CAK69350.1 unnamed protein product [Paramecium tetraurelia]|eukprot:XP_001436747.1 hypothetical protein (macronuclear) [Paramecium tetraurelia strain d4-2]
MFKESIFQSTKTKLVWSYLPMPVFSKNGALDGEFIKSGTNTCKIKKYILIQNILGCYTKKGTIKWINYENSLIEVVRDKMLGDGISLTKGETLILYGETEIWFNYMKRWCIQQGFSNTYKILEKIGKGNQAEVYSCRYQLGDEKFAVKQYSKHKLTNRLDKIALLKEISILRQVQHENVVHLYEVFENEDTIYVVMELLEGGDLYDYLKQPNSFLSEKQLASFIYRLFKAILSFHKFGIMHRDLKPKNIILRKQSLSQFCVADFGLADYFNKDGKYLFQRCGTPGFVAPEILRDEFYDFKVDVFSVGVIMYIIICGEEPFAGDYNETITKNYQGQVDVSKLKVSEQGLLFLKSLFEVKELRPTVKEAMNHQWFKQEKIVTEKYRIRIKEPQIKQAQLFLPSTRETLASSHSQFLKPMRTASSTRNSNYRLSPIGSQKPNKTPNPSPSLKRKSLK